MQTVITQLLSDPSARSADAVEKSLLQQADVATPWNNIAEE